MNKIDALTVAEHEGFTFEFADYWLDVYLDTRGEDAALGNFIEFLGMKGKK